MMRWTPRTTRLQEANLTRRARHDSRLSAGFYDSPAWNKKYPKLQILTIAELLQGTRVECPPSRYADATFKKAPREKIKRRKSGDLEDVVRSAGAPLSPKADADADVERPEG